MREGVMVDRLNIDWPSEAKQAQAVYVISIIGDHNNRWRQVFKILDGILTKGGNEQLGETMRPLRSSLARRAS